ncbi:sulfur carrier protein ThiS [Flavobacterium sp.]|uniref:sulfur carrier protein ThiS n=1 Tax=Flavobacterium sp. TaxID=239 RepID=UPI00261C4D30|nr:sulfur carrier protein ThiS [Flavobacterium sp.]
MELKINNQLKQFAPDSLTVQALLNLEIPSRQNGIAVAINQTVIPKWHWDSHYLNETDDILIISATQGG